MREVFRIGFETGNAHRAQNIGFNPVAVPGDVDYGNIYCSFGDNTQNGIIDLRDNGQNFSNVAGSVVRIHPGDPSGQSDPVLTDLGLKRSANGKYSIPTSTEFLKPRALTTPATREVSSPDPDQHPATAACSPRRRDGHGRTDGQP
jgi:hypothetical protein